MIEFPFPGSKIDGAFAFSSTQAERRTHLAATSAVARDRKHTGMMGNDGETNRRKEIFSLIPVDGNAGNSEGLGFANKGKTSYPANGRAIRLIENFQSVPFSVASLRSRGYKRIKLRQSKTRGGNRGGSLDHRRGPCPRMCQTCRSFDTRRDTRRDTRCRYSSGSNR